MPDKKAGNPGDGPYSIGRRVWAKFPRVDDLPSLADCRIKCAEYCGFDWWQCRVDSMLTLSAREYDALADSLLDSHPAYEGLGGTETDSPPQPPARYSAGESPLRQSRLRTFRKVILVQARRREPFAVDPHLSGHARSVGLEVRQQPPEIHEPGNYLGRWLRHERNNRLGVVCDSGVHKIYGRICLKTIVLMDRLPVQETLAPSPEETVGDWQWAFANPDHEKMAREEITTLRDRAREHQEAILERHQAHVAALEEETRRQREEFRRRMPEWAKAVIVAELHRAEDAFPEPGRPAHRRLFLAWSRHERNHADELRRAAARFGPLAHLAGRPQPEYEHRERTGKGPRLCLAEPDSRRFGWKVLKRPCAYVCDMGVEWEAPELLPA